MSPPAFDVASNKELITRRQFSHVAPCSLFVTAHTKPKGLVKSSGTTSCAAVVTPLVQLCPNPIGHPHTTPCHQHTRLLHTAAVMPLVQLCPIAIGHQYTRLYHQHTRLYTLWLCTTLSWYYWPSAHKTLPSAHKTLTHCGCYALGTILSEPNRPSTHNTLPPAHKTLHTSPGTIVTKPGKKGITLMYCSCHVLAIITSWLQCL